MLPEKLIFSCGFQNKTSHLITLSKYIKWEVNLHDGVCSIAYDRDFEILSLFSDTFKLNTACGSVEKHNFNLVQERVSVPSKEEIPIFIENVVWAIRQRGIFMLAMIKIATSDIPKKQYKRDEWNATDIYKEIFYYCSNPESPFVGTDDVINKILSKLKDKESGFNAYKDLSLDQQDKVKIILEAAKEAVSL